jgi:lysophospholipase L1-like esterase
MILPAPRLFVLLALILAVEFVVLEAGLRLHGGSEASLAFQSLFMQDPVVGHRPQPGARIRYSTAEFTTDLAINGQGVRDDEEIGPKAPDERRVVILGDSLVLSVQVPLGDTFGEILERRLSAADPAHRWRVINAGVQGYGPVQEWLFFRNVVSELEPDIVLVMVFVANDAAEAADTAAWLEAGRRVEPASEAAMNSVRRLVRSSMVLQLARVRYDLLKARLTGPTPERPLAAYLETPPADIVRGLQVSREAFQRIADRAARVGARTGLVLMPARFQTDDADFGRLDAAVTRAGGRLVRDAATQRFRDAVSPMGLPVFDLLPVLAAEPDRVGLFFQRNIHLTPRGHRVAAGALFDFLETSRLAASAR